MRFLPTFIATAALLTGTGCATVNSGDSGAQANPQDPWEGFNRSMFEFNEVVDGFIFKPIAKGYRAVTPDVVETGVSNFFNNIGELGNIANDLLQAKFEQAANDTSRLLINSSLGVVGIFDVAKHMGLQRNEGEDFGQTLAAWGVDSGPYMVLPFLGPVTVRDGLGMPVDMYTSPVGYIDHVPTRNSTRGMQFIDVRAGLLDIEDTISGDKYSFMRDAYLQRREYLIKDGQVEDSFGAGLDDEEFED
ncbi:MAG: VacJ family lipoprotein [Cellvibrionaceae bacterium]|nr:VacJ family lipoprotein [Cellvibrionaceae bacterium]MCV6625606.1 VacJ family lipoprotein [Cellvibrionaceae bacterium]